MDEYRPTRVKYPELCDEIQESLDGSPFRLEDRIGLGYCNSAIRGIRVWPMFEQLYIFRERNSATYF